MTVKKVAVNSKTSGKYTRTTVGGRDHILTNMMPIRGDITMNKIFYPNDQVKASYSQLNLKPAPNGHPSVAGEHISAFHPLAVNAFNIGAFVRSPRMKGKEVYNELLVDVEVANQSEDGIELMRRIEEGEEIGVSTGLTINELEEKTGVDDFGVAYSFVGRGFNFDHVAVLLNEDAAGKHAGTAVVNADDPDSVIITNMDVPAVHGNASVQGLTTSNLNAQLHDLLKQAYHGGGDREYLWVCEIFLDTEQVIFEHETVDGGMKLRAAPFNIDSNGNVTLTGVAQDVRKKVTFEPLTDNPQTTSTEGDDMEMQKLVRSVIGNANNGFTIADYDSLMAMTEEQIVNAICVAPTEDQIEKLMVNTGVDMALFEDFKTNVESFGEYKATVDAEIAELSKNIIANSEYTEELLKGKPMAELQIIANSLKKSIKLESGGFNVNTDEDAVVTDYSC